MSYWLFDPELFLYAKGTGPDDVLLRRCKKIVSSSSSVVVVPMKADDFDFVKIVKNHLELIGSIFTWDEPDYNRLVKYIYENRLLVNSQGFVFAELLHKADKDGNKTIDDANEELPAIYIRSLDVLPLKPYIPNLTERPIPLRTVKYLGDVNGRAASMEEDSNVTKLAARVDSLEAENIRLESKNNTLESNVTKLIADLTAITADLSAITHKVVASEARIMYVEGRVAKLISYLIDEKSPDYKQEVWMNDLKDFNWVGVNDLSERSDLMVNFTSVGPQGSYTRDCSKMTNVRATYHRRGTSTSSTGDIHYVAISVEDLTPYNKKARFYSYWHTYKFQGKLYVIY